MVTPASIETEEQERECGARPWIRRLIDLALEEDLAAGDCTSELTVPADQDGRAEMVARESLCWCQGGVLRAIIERYGAKAHVAIQKRDGERVAAGAVVAHVEGRLRDILALERTMLNFVQRMSGVATTTAGVVAGIRDLRVLDTRKTMPGWRLLDKYAVRCGGGQNHRMSLGDMVLVKNNHIDACGGDVSRTLERVVRNKPPYMPWEVEVRSIAELRAAIPFRPTIIMLDNFTDRAIAEALPIVRSEAPGVMVEISGGVTRERLSDLAALGVDLVSMGALTTQSRNVDISLRVGTVG